MKCIGQIGIEGDYETMSEIAFSLQSGVAVIRLKTTYLDRQMIQAADPEEAVEQAFAAIGRVHAASVVSLTLLYIDRSP